MTTQQGELLIRQRNPQTQRPEWARAYVVLAVDERQLFCFTDEKFDAPRCVLQLRGASVGGPPENRRTRLTGRAPL